MFLVISKRFLWAAGLLVCGIAALGTVFWQGFAREVPVFSAEDGVPVTVVVDPGHGGEDGGASAADGTLESDLNLAVALRLNDLLRFAGQRTVMTRATEAAIFTEGDTIRARKVSDTRNRVEIVNGAENGVLVSIHQNSLPSSPATHGAYVFHNGIGEAQALAESVQSALNAAVNESEKQVKTIFPTVYLMNHVTAPGVLVECGFLTNPSEAARLKTPEYQLRLAAVIAAGLLGTP